VNCRDFPSRFLFSFSWKSSIQREADVFIWIPSAEWINKARHHNDKQKSKVSDHDRSHDPKQNLEI